MDFATIATMFGVTEDEFAKQILFLAVASFSILLFMGLTNKVVVFADGKDLMYSLGIVIVPIVGFISLIFFEPQNPPADYDIFLGSGSSSAVTVTTAGCVVYCIIMSYIQAIKHNGIILGVVVGTFKVVSALIITISAIGWLNKMFGNGHKSIGTWIMMVLVLGLFGWVVRKLVNGEAVALKRAQSQAE